MEKSEKFSPIIIFINQDTNFSFREVFFYMMMMNSWVNTFFAQTLVKKKKFFFLLPFYTDNLPFS